MRSLRLALVAVVASTLLTLGCDKPEACVMPTGDGSAEICTLQKKSVCEQGKGHKFLGGDCALAGYAKQTSDGVWEKAGAAPTKK